MIAAHQTMLAPQGAPLPYDYVCQYHTFDGYSCVVTDSVPDATKKWRVVFDGTYVTDGEANVIGLYDNTTGTANRVYGGIYYSSARCNLVATAYDIAVNVKNAYVEQTIDLVAKLHTVIKGGATTTKVIGNYGTFVTQKPLGLGGRNNYNTGSPPHKLQLGFKGKVYSFEEWTSGTKTADWIPVVVGTEACYYDQITGQIYHADLTIGNALTAGPQA